MSESKHTSKNQAGFTLAEFMISTVILLLISAAVFQMLAETQRTSSYQTEVQATMDNMRLAIDTVERYIRQTGNNPLNIAGFEGVINAASTSVRLRSDLTGAVPPNQGDPDGDTADAGEDITIQYNAGTQSVELVPNGGGAQAIANYISAFNLQYFDQNGNATTVGANVRRIRVTVTGTTTIAHPQTKKTFGHTMSSDIQLATRS